MAVKYRVNYRNHFNDLCRVDILHDSYIGDPVILRGVAEKACVISWDCSEDPYEPIVNSKALISVYQTEDYPIDILELQQAQDREFKVEFYIENVIKFKGFMVSDGLQRSFQAAPFEFNITATDGLMLLDGVTYSHNNLTGGRCILNYLRQILFSNSNLGLALPIQWVVTLTNDLYYYEPDIFSGSVQWSPRGEGFTDYNGNTKTCMYILEGMLRSMQCRIAQTDGKWVIWRINDVVSGIFLYRETPATLDGFSVTEGDVTDYNKTIAGNRDMEDYAFIQEDAILTSAPGLKTVTTRYNQDQRENIIPNGNMDIVLGITNTPLYWYAPGASVQSVPSLSNAAGSAVEISNPVPNGDTVFTLINENIPIDSDVLYSYINFGFKFSIINGATLDPDGYIVWDATDFSLRVIYAVGAGLGDIYYLNENGFWTNTVTYLNISVGSLKLNDVAQIDFNSRQDIILPLPKVVPIPMGSVPLLRVLFEIPSGRKVIYDDVYMNVESNSDVYEGVVNTKNTGKEEYELNISSSHNGFYVSNYMSNYDYAGEEKFYSDSKLTEATLTEMNTHAILRNRYKPSLLFDGSIYARNYKYAEIYNIKTLEGKKFLPLKSNWNTETCTTDITLMEIRDDGIGISITHYGSNDKTILSN